MGAYDLSAIADKVKKVYGKDNCKGIGTAEDLMTFSDYVVMPDWWQEGTGTKGIPFGNLAILAGPKDSGKTTMCLEIIKQAQAQDIAVLLVETEFKTKQADLISSGIDPKNLLLVQEKIAERAYDKMFNVWDAFKDKYPEGKLLIVVDSLGNLISERDRDLDLADNASPGGAGKVNRRAINKMIAKTSEDRVAMLIVSYVYANMGSPGVVVAGGNALGHASVLTYVTRRMGWKEGKQDGDDMRSGAKFKWTLDKNHINRTEANKKHFIWQISNKGISLLNGAKEVEED